MASDLDVCTERRPRAQRIRQGVLFCCLTVLVATSFVVVDFVSTSGMDLLAGHFEFFGEKAVPPATLYSTSCAVEPGAPTQGPDADYVRAGAWTLGLILGRHSFARQRAHFAKQPMPVPVDLLAELVDGLMVPAPPSLQPTQFGRTMAEFGELVEQDATGTAKRLAHRHSPTVCHLYKLGAFWGYADRMRLDGVDESYGRQIEHYALLAGLPPGLWEPMMRPSRTATTSEREAEAEALAAAVAAHLLGQDPAP